MKSTVLVILGLLFVSCHSLPQKSHEFKAAQLLVEQTIAKHPGVVRLTIHAIPAGRTKSMIIACNIREKLGALSDPEDLMAMKTGKFVILKEGDKLDVTAPILDRSGEAIAATGITLSFSENTSEKALVDKAIVIAQELTTAIQNAQKPLW